ncbi:response regulator transcription factor [Sinosporangium siamense]|uniref:DNA-binding response regulator n=1 Tax=Sinosporangium siamense TaxID=1367973 RepID=A0A919RCQ5_9ACTN|nr:response regulator transcription factor [Sinosporangium siamense]GII90059.1 DNA-binding response regulator [Sinosporangium siamense]
MNARENGRVAVVDDQPVAAAGLRLGIEAAGYAVVAEVRSVEELDPELEVDVVVCDYWIRGGRSRVEAVEFLVRRGLLVLSVSAVATAEAVLDVIAAGACGFIHKDAEILDYPRALAHSLADGCYLSPLLAGYLLEDANRRPLDSDDIGRPERLLLRTVADGKTSQDAVAALELTRDVYLARLRLIFTAAGRRRKKHRLTPREMQIVQMIVLEGMTARQIARRLDIRPDTVADHLNSIKRKYQAMHPDNHLAPRAIVLQWARELGMLH